MNIKNIIILCAASFFAINNSFAQKAYLEFNYTSNQKHITDTFIPYIRMAYRNAVDEYKNEQYQKT